nr:hypothetical protein [Angustibacter aerolatus]
MLLLNAGHEASVNGFGNGLVSLLQAPDQAPPAARAPRRPRRGGARRRGDAASRQPAAPVRPHRHAGRRAWRCPASRRRCGCAPATGCRRCSGPPTATRPSSPNPTASWPTATRTRTWPSGPASTSASARRWPGSSLQVSLPALLRRHPGLHLEAEPVRRPTFVLRGYERVVVAG